jgi:hypothetical protein
MWPRLSATSFFAAAAVLVTAHAASPSATRRDNEKDEQLGIAFFKTKHSCAGLASTNVSAKMQRNACLRAARDARAARSARTPPESLHPPPLPLAAAGRSTPPAMVSRAVASPPPMPSPIRTGASSSQPPLVPKPARAGRLRAQPLRGVATQPPDEPQAQRPSIPDAEILPASASLLPPTVALSPPPTAPKSWLCATLGICLG